MTRKFAINKGHMSRNRTPDDYSPTLKCTEVYMILLDSYVALNHFKHQFPVTTMTMKNGQYCATLLHSNMPDTTQHSEILPEWSHNTVQSKYSMCEPCLADKRGVNVDTQLP